MGDKTSLKKKTFLVKCEFVLAQASVVGLVGSFPPPPTLLWTNSGFLMKTITKKVTSEKDNLQPECFKLKLLIHINTTQEQSGQQVTLGWYSWNYTLTNPPCAKGVFSPKILGTRAFLKGSHARASPPIT